VTILEDAWTAAMLGTLIVVVVVWAASPVILMRLRVKSLPVTK
jgi:hypothetical protein